MEQSLHEMKTKRLQILQETLADAKDLHEILGCDPAIARYTGWNPYVTMEDTIDKIRKDQLDDSSYSWVIKKDGQFLGTIGAYDYCPEEKSIEIGYSIGRKFWGNGYAGEAVKAVTAYLLKEPQIQKLHAWSHVENISSIKVLLGAGFQEVQREKNQVIFEKHGEGNGHGST